MAIDLERASAKRRGSALSPGHSSASANGAGTHFLDDTVEQWEIHSELVLVSPEVRRHALEVLARERTVHLLRYPAADRGRDQTSAQAPFVVALGLYLARAVVLTLVLALIAAGGTFAVALALELLPR